MRYARLIKGRIYGLKQYTFRNTGNSLTDFVPVDDETAGYLQTLDGRFEIIKQLPKEFFDNNRIRRPAQVAIDFDKLRYWQEGKFRWDHKQPVNMVPFPMAMRLVRSGNFRSADPRLTKYVFRDGSGAMHLEWRGIINAHDGYGLSNIRFVEHLVGAGVKLSLYPHGYHKPQDQGAIISAYLKLKKENCRWGVLYGQPPGFNDLKTPCRIGFTMFETTRIPQEWVPQCNAMDRIWVPSKFCRTVFRRCGVEVPIDIIPLGYEDSIFYFKPHEKKKVFTFFIAANLSSRKNTVMALRAFQQAFKRHKNVKFAVWPGIFDIKDSAELKEFLDDKRIEIKRFNYSSKEFAEQLWESDCFVFPTHGEGFGIPPVEAMACGAPVICTAWSGCTEYMDRRYNFPIRVKGVERTRDMEKYYCGDWAVPDFGHLKKLMLHAYRGRDEAMEKAQRCAEWIKRFAVKNIVPRMIEIIKKADAEIGAARVAEKQY